MDVPHGFEMTQGIHPAWTFVLVTGGDPGVTGTDLARAIGELAQPTGLWSCSQGYERSHREACASRGQRSSEIWPLWEQTYPCRIILQASWPTPRLPMSPWGCPGASRSPCPPAASEAAFCLQAHTRGFVSELKGAATAKQPVVESGGPLTTPADFPSGPTLPPFPSPLERPASPF